ncbi:hypothetical protein D0B54_00915 [Solimonas sp. K1W22B-7]|uniref:hypothetical protein n=1 Tax=Solimonas sp. K1W22B-7 TaxID=2303331 RepID=UPI000E32FDF2|nr:hypothetical protein [Solimonas sp. K1W22B-7]AXQ27335.1 hypothetical protein D0B54_00915 [Solimonas sp. K1W22B-7]
MKIIGIDGLNGQQLQDEINRGGKFVLFQYCVSILVMTFKRPSNIYFVRSGQSPVVKGLGFSLLSFLAGWWGFPWGPIYTIGALFTNFSGGKDVTQEVLASLSQPHY